MKNFKLFLFGGVFCSLIVSTAVAVERTCADEMPTCEQLGYKWNCSTNHALWGELELPSLSCPWDENVKYCPGARKEAENSEPKTIVVDLNRANCAALCFTDTEEDCDPYISLPCPFDSNYFFCASPEAKLPTVTSGTTTKPGTGVGNSGGTTISGTTAIGDGNSTVASGLASGTTSGTIQP